MQLRFFVFALLIFGQKLCANNLDRVIEAIDNQNASQVIAVFDSMDPMTLTEARSFLAELYAHYDQIYGSNLRKPLKKPSLSYLTLGCKFKTPLEFLANQYTFASTILTSYLASPFINSDVCIKINQTTALLLTSNDWNDELPIDFVLGGVEMLAGALIYILPFPPAKWLGGVMIADGINRTFNGIRDLDEQNKAHIFKTDHSKFKTL